MEFDNIKKTLKSNKVKIKNHFGKKIRSVEVCLEKQNEIIFDYCTNINFSYKDNNFPELRGIVYKNTMNMRSALELIKIGYHSSASILLRNVYEGFLIILLVERYNDMDIYNKFRKGKTIEPHRAIQEEESIPNDVKKEIKILWNFLCKKTHATTASMQIILKFDNFFEKESLSNKKLTEEIFGILSVFTHINWILCQKYVFDCITDEILIDIFKEEGKFQHFLYTFKIADNLSGQFKDKYASNSLILIDFFEDYMQEISLNIPQIF